MAWVEVCEGDGDWKVGRGGTGGVGLVKVPGGGQGRLGGGGGGGNGCGVVMHASCLKLRLRRGVHVALT